MKAERRPLEEQVVVRKTAKLLIPFVVVFGVYMITHGEIGPGGGFQGGVVIAAAYFLYALVHGLAEVQRVVPRRVTDALAALGVLLYAGVGVAALLRGGRFLEYAALGAPGDAVASRALGMTLVELGVGVTVAATMITIFNEVVDDGGR